jgi:hypothetical protein
MRAFHFGAMTKNEIQGPFTLFRMTTFIVTEEYLR